MSSFEVRLTEDTSVCMLVPASGSISTTFVGSLQGALGSVPDGGYSTELLRRSQDVEDSSLFFTKAPSRRCPLFSPHASSSTAPPTVPLVGHSAT